MKVNTKSVEPIVVITLHITIRIIKRDSIERSTKCGTELTLTSISLNGMGQTSRSGKLPRARRHVTARHTTLQKSKFISIVTDENIHMHVRFGNERTKNGDFRLRDELLSYIFSHLRITYYYTAVSVTSNGITFSLLLDTRQCQNVSCLCT